MACVFCKSSEDDYSKFGELLTEGNVIAHHFCLLFAPGLPQKGQDDEGLQGFLIEDILAEVKRIKALKCFYCRGKSANLGCCVEKCKKSYHTSCGYENKASYVFVDPYKSFCYAHSRKPKKIQTKSCRETCQICLHQIGRVLKPIQVPCCLNWFHHSCLQKFAGTSGSLFKCPLCNDKDHCHEILPKQGIFIPQKEADWEIEFMEHDTTSNFAHMICDHPECVVELLYQDSPWFWKLCSICGSSGAHLSCVANEAETFICRSCNEILNKTAKQQQESIEKEEKSPRVLRSTAKKRKFQSWLSDEELGESDFSSDDEDRIHVRRKIRSLPETDISSSSESSSAYHLTHKATGAYNLRERSCTNSR